MESGSQGLGKMQEHPLTSSLIGKGAIGIAASELGISLILLHVRHCMEQRNHRALGDAFSL